MRPPIDRNRTQLLALFIYSYNLDGFSIDSQCGADQMSYNNSVTQHYDSFLRLKPSV